MRASSRLSAAAAATAVVLLGVALVGMSAEAKKKGSKGGGAAKVTTTVGKPIPDGMAGANGVLHSTVTIGKKFKGRSIGDVNLTFQTTGASADSANDIRVRLTAPNGATAYMNLGANGQSIGPLTLDDETPVRACNAPVPPCGDPDRSLNRPYVGRAAPVGDELFRLDGGPMRGTWTFRVTDISPGETSTLDFWALEVAPERPAAPVKGKPGPAADVTTTLNQQIPDPPALGAPDGFIRSTVVLGKKFKGKSIGDVNVTVQYTGAQATSAEHVRMRLVSPRGNTADVIGRFNPTGLPGQSVGPLTLDDETVTQLCFDDTPPCSEPDSLTLPFAGTAQPTGHLSDLDGGPMRGTWTLTVRDTLAGETTVFNTWRLRVTPKRPAR